MKFCYQCDAQVTYLFADARCAKCTRLTPEEVRGEPKENDMRQSNENTVDIECQVKRETEKALLIDHGGEQEVWMPKSQIKNVAKNGRTVTLTVTEWIANEKGLL